MEILKIVDECKAISGFQIYAYCMMGNHVHLLIREAKETLEQVVKRIGVRYVHWYNTKYQRVGHLFQDRFKSEPIDSNEYFLAVLRYIHQNPIKAKICKKLDDYLYSSYHEYLNQAWLVESEYVFGLIREDEFVSFHNAVASDMCLEIEAFPKISYTDEQAKKIIEKVSRCKTVSEFQGLDKESRNRYLSALREKGLSIRQISRLTGISFNVVRKA